MTVPIICPFTSLRPETKAALENESVIYVDVSSSENDYWGLLAAIWQTQKGVILVEHDIVPQNGAISSLQECSYDWCGCPYLVGRNFVVDLGLTKFSPEIMKVYPDAIERMETHHWKSLDGQLLGYLRPLRGAGPHWHWPAARHLNDCGDESRVLANCGDCGAPIRFAEAQGGPGTVRCANGHYCNFFPKG